ncbi:MAG: response regulator transcription factor [Spirochaetaceae bacterium]
METKPTILIVDDEEINRNFFDVMLTRLGFRVLTARDGEQALDVIPEEKPDLIILDNIMPKFSGWEVTRRIKQDEAYAEVRDTPVIMFSAMDEVQDKIEGFELGVEDYITKPFNFSEVLARIKAVLRHREVAQQVVHRERRLAVVESLNKSLLYFTEHVKGPITTLLEQAQNLDSGDPSTVDAFVEMAKTEAERTLASLSALEEEVEELRGKGDEIKAQEVTVGDLEQKYQEHFRRFRDSIETIDEVRKG